MRLEMFVACLFLLPGIAKSWYNAVLDFPSEPSVDNFVMWTPIETIDMQEALSVCSWVKPTKSDTRSRFWLSYQPIGSSNDLEEINMCDNLGATALFSTITGTPAQHLESNKWHHVCMTWSLSDQTVRVYLAGKEVSSKTTAANRKFGKRGVFVLGQEQDQVGGNFDVNQAFIGELYQLNMYSRALSGEEVERAFNRGLCASSDPSIAKDITIAWQDVLAAPRNGEVRIKRGTCSHWNLVSDYIDRDLLQHLIKYHDH